MWSGNLKTFLLTLMLKFNYLSQVMIQRLWMQEKYSEEMINLKWNTYLIFSTWNSVFILWNRTCKGKPERKKPLTSSRAANTGCTWWKQEGQCHTSCARWGKCTWCSTEEKQRRIRRICWTYWICRRNRSKYKWGWNSVKKVQKSEAEVKKTDLPRNGKPNDIHYPIPASKTKHCFCRNTCRTSQTNKTP